MSIDNLGNLLIHTGTRLNENGDVGLGEVVKDGYNLGTTFIPFDENVSGNLGISVDPETGIATVSGDKINFGAFTDDAIVDVAHGSVIVKNGAAIVGTAGLQTGVGQGFDPYTDLAMTGSL